MVNFKVANSLKFLNQKQPRPTKPNEICNPCGTHLGDCWSFVSYVLKNQIKTIAVSGDTERKIQEIIPLLDSNHRPSIDQQSGSKTVWSFGHQYVKTKIAWADGYYGKICYQFDGKSFASAKNIPKSKELKIIETIENLGVIPVKLGAELSLSDCVKEAASSDLFVGVESGMSHLCHSVRVPIIIIPSNLNSDHIQKHHDHNEYEEINNSLIYARIKEIIDNKRKLVQTDKIGNKSLMSLGYNFSMHPKPRHKPRYRMIAS